MNTRAFREGRRSLALHPKGLGHQAGTPIYHRPIPLGGQNYRWLNSSISKDAGKSKVGSKLPVFNEYDNVDFKKQLQKSSAYKS